MRGGAECQRGLGDGWMAASGWLWFVGWLAGWLVHEWIWLLELGDEVLRDVGQKHWLAHAVEHGKRGHTQHYWLPGDGGVRKGNDQHVRES